MKLSDNETDFLNHNSRWGSDGYPISKTRGGWTWNELFGVRGSPSVYKTKREAGDAIELYIDILCDRKAGRI